MTIVGVVGDVRNLGLQTDPSPKIFASFAQDPQAQMSMALRIAATNPVLRASAVREQVWVLDKEQPTFDVATMEERMAESLSTQRWNMWLLTAFALTALVLAAAGIYGVISYFALRRTHEIGVRKALGATPQSILALVLRQGATTAVLGSTLGIAASFALTGFIRGMIYGIRVTDPATYVAVGLLLTGVALLASYIPARRAAEVDPMVALRYQ
jgi:putative ABC transport system permease protein